MLTSRQERILGSLLKGAAACRVGAEIGPLHRALVPKAPLPAEAAVFYVDRCDTEALRAYWRHDASIDPALLHVDAVWGQDDLRQALDRSELARQRGLCGHLLDYVVASHVVEHVPDLIGWLQEVAAVLRPGGALRLAVPDKRYCFDHLRRTSGLAQVCEAFVCRRRRPSPEQVLDFALHEVAVDTAAAWQGDMDPATLKRCHTFHGALGLARDVHDNGAYHDVHCWTFTPASWTGLMLTLAREGLVPFSCERLFPTPHNELEFYVWMTRCDDAAEAADSWRQRQAELTRTDDEHN